jgi:kumamolisin
MGKAFNDITSGNNDMGDITPVLFQAKQGWDACSGWGSPNGTNLRKAFQTPP